MHSARTCMHTLTHACTHRADIKQYIGLPSPHAIYQILRSCLLELMRVHIIAPAGELLPATSLTPQHTEVTALSADGSACLFFCAVKAHGLSGRALRKLPFLAHAKFLHSKGLRLFGRLLVVLVRIAASQGVCCRFHFIMECASGDIEVGLMQRAHELPVRDSREALSVLLVSKRFRLRCRTRALCPPEIQWSACPSTFKRWCKRLSLSTLLALGKAMVVYVAVCPRWSVLLLWEACMRACAYAEGICGGLCCVCGGLCCADHEKRHQWNVAASR